jgi:hypothetical protein
MLFFVCILLTGRAVVMRLGGAGWGRGEEGHLSRAGDGDDEGSVLGGGWDGTQAYWLSA